MYRYKYNASYHHKSRRAKRTTAVATFFVLLFIGAAVYVAIDVYYNGLKKETVTSQSNYSSVQGASISIVRTPYFQFQLPANWREVASESRDKHYVYRSYRKEFVEEELVIEIDRAVGVPVNNNTTSHVLAVSYDKSGIFNIVTRISEPCQDVYPNVPGEKTKQDNPRVVKQHDVTFACNPGSGFYQAVVGLAGGGEDMILQRQDGIKEKVNITYKNVTAIPTPNHLYDIIESLRMF
jgi:hypothetical protein